MLNDHLVRVLADLFKEYSRGYKKLQEAPREVFQSGVLHGIVQTAGAILDDASREKFLRLIAEKQYEPPRNNQGTD